MADITTVYLPLAFHLTPSRGLTLIKQVVPVHWPTALELRGGGALYNTFFSERPPLPTSISWACMPLFCPPALCWPRPPEIVPSSKTLPVHEGGARRARVLQRARAPRVSMRAFSNFPCSCCSGAASIDVEQLWQTQSTAGVPTWSQFLPVRPVLGLERPLPPHPLQPPHQPLLLGLHPPPPPVSDL